MMCIHGIGLEARRASAFTVGLIVSGLCVQSVETWLHRGSLLGLRSIDRKKRGCIVVTRSVAKFDEHARIRFWRQRRVGSLR